jgi:hypothetical protein
LPAAQRSFRVDSFGLPPGVGYRAADRTATAALAPLPAGPRLRATVFRTLTVDGEQVQLAGVDDLEGLVRLRSGRLPRSCRPARCEVLQIGAGGRSALDEADIHLARVGTAEVPSGGALAGLLAPLAANGGHAALLIAAGVGAFDRVPAFAPFYRTYSWIEPIQPHALHVWQIARVLGLETRAQAQLARISDVFALSGPDQALLDARDRGRVAARRLVLVGGEVSALVLGFALVAAIGLRRGLAAERRRLLQRGARRAQAWLSTTAEVATMTLAGSILGVVLGVIVVALLAGRAGLPDGPILEHALAAVVPVGVVLAAAVVATVAVLAVAAIEEDEGRHRRLRALDVAALGALAAVAVGLSRGGLSASSLSSGSDGTLLLLLPGLICFAAAVLAARLLGPLMRVGEWATRRAPVAPRLALLALARAPARTAATAAFLVVSLGLAFFASSYRATLAAGARDEAAFAVPLDFTASEGPRLVLPLQAAPLQRFRAIAPGVCAYPVVRQTATVAGLGASVQSPTVLGLPTAALARLHWRSDFAATAPATLARRLAADGPAHLQGVPLPPAAGMVSTDVRVRGATVGLDLVAADRSGTTVVVPLGEHRRGSSRVQARLPRGLGLRQIVGLEVTLGHNEQFVFEHRSAEGNVVSPAAGSLSMGPLIVGLANGRARTLTRWQGWIAHGADRVQASRRLALAYTFDTGQTVVVRRPQSTDGRPLRVVVSPDVARAAGPGGLLTLDFQTVQVPARIVGVASRFPAAEQGGEGFVVGDESRLATALDADAPGTGTPGEIWLSVPAGANREVARALRRPPFSQLVVGSRVALEDAFTREPLARAITITLATAAVLTLVLAAVGFGVALTSELRDERDELFDLEAQGVAPSTLRQQFRVRAVVLVLLGALGGAAVGLLLSRLVVAVVRVSAATSSPDPPLRLEPSWLLAGAGLAVLVVALAGVVELTTRTAFRGDVPRRGAQEAR